MPRPVVSSLIGGSCWLITVMWLHPSPFDLQWGIALLLLAPLVLVPLGMQLATSAETAQDRLWQWAGRLQTSSALLLMIAFARWQERWLAILSLPWLAVTLLIALYGWRRAWRRGLWPVEELCIDAGLIYLAVGGVWAALARFGVRPLQFDSVIVVLTAIHFHYAGFVLPLITGLAGRRLKNKIARIAALLVIAGIPLTATGITATQSGFSHLIETGAALLTVAAGMLTAWLHFSLSLRADEQRLTRVLWLIVAVSLAFSLTLAALYGLRWYAPMQWLDIPWMRALHGTANALGVGLIGPVAWITFRLKEE